MYWDRAGVYTKNKDPLEGSIEKKKNKKKKPALGYIVTVSPRRHEKREKRTGKIKRGRSLSHGVPLEYMFCCFLTSEGKNPV